MIERLNVWTRERTPFLTDTNSAAIHTSELGLECAPTALVERSSRLFFDAVAGRWPWLDDIVLMLMIPLRDSRALMQQAPRWDELPKLLSRTPPGIYILRPASYFQFDDSVRLIAPMEDLPNALPGTYAEFRCWKNERHSPTEGWARDVRLVRIPPPPHDGGGGAGYNELLK